MTSPRMPRRDVLRGSGGLVIGIGKVAPRRRSGLLAHASTAAPGFAPSTAASRPTTVQARGSGGDDAWLTIDADGGVTVYSGKVELGTGVRTALAQLVAEELDVPFARVTMVMGDTRLTPDQGGTTGSKTIQDAGPGCSGSRRRPGSSS